MKIYTRIGDQGKSSLFSGERVSKHHVRMRAYGELDELNAVIGALMAGLPEAAAGVHQQLKQIQSDLFQIGAWLATTPDSEALARLPRITEAHVKRLEDYIDGLQKYLPVLNAFILPGGHMSAAWAHIARTVCRRCERSTVEMAQSDALRKTPDGGLAPILAYLNRLSDHLFVVARFCNRAAGVEDQIWRP